MNLICSNGVPSRMILVVLMAVSVVICKAPRRLVSQPIFTFNSVVRSLGGWSPRIPPKMKYSKSFASLGWSSTSARGSKRQSALLVSPAGSISLTSLVVHWIPKSSSSCGMSESVVDAGREVKMRFSLPISRMIWEYSSTTHLVKPCSMCSITYFMVQRCYRERAK